jgi:SAM-dependent methyltransferase
MSQTNADILRGWQESARYWEKHRSIIREMFAPITRALMGAAAISEGHRVLDVAGGTGEPSLTIAEAVGESGFVTCTDAVAEMVKAARREAARRDLSNAGFVQSLAELLPVEGDCFDATVSRLGVMFFTNPLAALTEMVRVTKPGGRISLVVWGDSAQNPFFRIVTEVAARYIESPPEDPDSPGAFRFAGPGKLLKLVEQTGAIDVSEISVPFDLEAPISLDEFWEVRSEISDSLREKLRRLAPDQLFEMADAVRESARPFFAHGRMRLPALVLIVTGTKP